MKRLVGLLALLALALAGAWLWRIVAADPGYVQIALRGWSVETTLVVAATALLLALAALWLVVNLLRMPWRFWSRRRRHVARERLAGGLVALHEGRWRRAERLLTRAASEPQHRLPALLGAARAAQSRGDTPRADELLAQAGERGDTLVAALLAARQHQRSGNAHAITALFDAEPAAALPPRALELYLQALAATGRAGEAMSLLPALRSSGVLEGEALAREEAAIMAASMQQAPDAQTLASTWGSLSRAQKTRAPIVAAYAKRAVELGEGDAGVAAVEGAMRKRWSPELAAIYGLLPRGTGRSPLKMAESWLAEHPGDPGLLVTLARLCRKEQIWGKAEDYLQRALARGAGAAAWEELGHVHAAQHRSDAAADAFAKALAVQRGERAHLRSDRPLREEIAEVAVAEVRSEMGVPLLPRGDVDEDEALPPA